MAEVHEEPGLEEDRSEFGTASQAPSIVHSPSIVDANQERVEHEVDPAVWDAMDSDERNAYIHLDLLYNELQSVKPRIIENLYK